MVRYDIGAGQRSLDLLRWGLVPHWAKAINVGFANINAKAEGIETRPAFRDAFQRRRCLVPVDSFYEWKKTATGKQPYAIALADRRLMALAGLWENWRAPTGEWVRTFAIITTRPNELCAELHNRMPVVLGPASWPAWLGEDPADPRQLKALLAPYPSQAMICWLVSRRVGNVKNNDPSLIEPLTVGEITKRARFGGASGLELTFPFQTPGALMTVNADCEHWSRVSREWIEWARAPDHDAFWAYRESLIAFVGRGEGEALDVGCGEGRVSRELKSCGYRVTASDPVLELVNAAKEARSADDYAIASGTDLPFEDARFDLVMAYNVLMDVEDVPATLKEIRRVLRPVGMLVISIVHPFSDRGRFATT